MKLTTVTAMAAIFLVAACAPAPSGGMVDRESGAAPVAITTAEVRPGTDTHIYEISWTTNTPAAPVRIEASPDPDFLAGEGTVIAQALTAANLSWSAEVGAPRQYFLIVPDEGKPERVSNRLLPLEGGRNFRDLGGYETSAGQQVKWGRLYRSGVMDALTPADYDYLSDLGIRVVCDLRTSQERAAEPTEWSGSDIDYLTFPDPADGEESAFLSVFSAPDVTPEMVAGMMADSYGEIAEQQAPAYREMFIRLAAGDAPLAFNCSAGKDRTGIGAALILTALGVPRDTILADYALSETYVDYMSEFSGASEGALSEDSPYAFLARLPPELVAPLMRSDPQYLEAAFEHIDTKYGSIDTFLETELGVTDAMIAEMRRLYLEG